MKIIAPTSEQLIDLAARARKNGANSDLVSELMSAAVSANALAANSARLSRREYDIAKSCGEFLAWRAGSALEDLALAGTLDRTDAYLARSAQSSKVVVEGDHDATVMAAVSGRESR
jgi:hypothetical protein